jgi:hypothetical protein
VDAALRPLADMPDSEGNIPGREELNLLCRGFFIDLRHKIEQLKNEATLAFEAL